MSMSLSFGRRRFLQTSAAALAASAVTPLMTQAAPPAPTDLTGRMYKTLKIGMVRVEGSLTDKFKAVKAAGSRPTGLSEAPICAMT